MPVHYLQSKAWLQLRSDFRKQKGIDVFLGSKKDLRLIGHVARERRRRSLRKDSVLEILYGPSSPQSSGNPPFDAKAMNDTIQIANGHKVRSLRILSYAVDSLGYTTLEEYANALRELGIPFKQHLTMTLFYDLDKHEFGSLDQCENTVRKNLRKASGVEIIRAESPEQIREYLIQHSLLKGRRSPSSNEIQAYQKWRDGCTLFMAFDSAHKKCLGTLGFFHDDFLGTEIASSTVKGPEARGVQEKLHLACFDEAKRLGLQRFDLAGLERDEDGNWNSRARFKMKFHGDLIESGTIEIDLRESRRKSN